MFEHISQYPADPKSQILGHNQSTETDLYRLNKIVAVSYDQNKSQRLPTDRYSLKISQFG